MFVKDLKHWVEGIHAYTAHALGPVNYLVSRLKMSHLLTGDVVKFGIDIRLVKFAQDVVSDAGSWTSFKADAVRTGAPMPLPPPHSHCFLLHFSQKGPRIPRE